MAFLKTRLFASKSSKKEFSIKSFVRSLSGTDMGAAESHEVRKGYVPVMVGSEGFLGGERFMIKTHLIKHPSIVALLELSADEFGYDQEGVLQIPCEPDYFRNTINKLSKSR
ncbi:hypothetical protein Droror1_Dr00019204 [Drosera rotundifolia]